MFVWHILPLVYRILVLADTAFFPSQEHLVRDQLLRPHHSDLTHLCHKFQIDPRPRPRQPPRSMDSAHCNHRRLCILPLGPLLIHLIHLIWDLNSKIQLNEQRRTKTITICEEYLAFNRTTRWTMPPISSILYVIAIIISFCRTPVVPILLRCANSTPPRISDHCLDGGRKIQLQAVRILWLSYLALMVL